MAILRIADKCGAFVMLAQTRGGFDAARPCRGFAEGCRDVPAAKHLHEVGPGPGDSFTEMAPGAR